jgi:bifunctional non-homologous end joining protein LigD
MHAESLTLRRWAALRSEPASLIFYVFDVLHLDGKDLREIPLTERRVKLQRLLGIDPTNQLQFSEEFVGRYRRLLSRLCRP